MVPVLPYKSLVDDKGGERWRLPAAAACCLRGVKGFTLLEVLIALAAAGLLVAMIASLLGQGAIVSSALERTAEGQRARVVLHRLLSLDLRNILPDTEISFTDHGFTMETSHNHLLQGPMPMTVTWTFSEKGMRRMEEQPELAYVRSVVLVSELENWSLTLYDLSQSRWIDLRSWLLAGERPAPAGMRLELQGMDQDQWRFIFRLPLQHDAPH